MTVAFLLLCIVIGGYLFITDSNRVRQSAESYLSLLLGGPVKVGDATLSIFEGLRLDKVRLYTGEPGKPETELFTAESFIINYNPQALLRGKIEATRIVAVEPKLFLTEDRDTGLWSYERYIPRGGGIEGAGMTIRTLPEIVLRNATVDYRQKERGKVTVSGSLDIEGQLTPTGEGSRYAFQFQSQSRGNKARAVGPVVEGTVDMTTRQVTASLRKFEFGNDIKSMLPSPVRRWWEQHQLTGSLDVNEVSYVPSAGPDSAAGFRAEIALQGVNLTVQPQEWMGEEEYRRMRILHHSLNVMRLCGLNGGGMVDRIATLVEPTPLKLHDVFAVFDFDDNGIEIRNLTGKLEDISFKIDGKILGYSPDAAWDLKIASVETRNVEIPASPRYVTSMPPAVRELYDRFRPRGEAAFWVRVHRPVEGARLRLTGEIDIVNGSFTFDKFPYPLRHTTGKIVLEYDQTTGRDGLRLERIRGRGIAGGPNENSFVEINGKMGPFRPDIGVDVIVTGQNITSEPALLAAFPQQTQTALRIFDAPGRGEFPKFRGDFGCHIQRLPQLESKWPIETDIQLDEAAGVLVMFPYLLSNVRGKLKILDDHLTISDMRMEKGDVSVQVDGRVSWRQGADSHPRAAATTQPALVPDIHVTAKNVPIDADLLAALPPDRRKWMEKIGLRGKLDIDGTVRAVGATTQPLDTSNIDFDMRLHLSNGEIWPAAHAVCAVSQLNGELHLTSRRLTITSLSGRRGQAEITSSGGVGWGSGAPQLFLHVDAKNLKLDDDLYRLLPEAAKRGWEQVRPEGTVDAVLSYSGVPGPETKSQPTTRPGGFELTIKPLQLAATPAAVPYRLEQISGTLHVMPDRVVLSNIRATHGQAKINLAGTGSAAPGGAWDFELSAAGVPIDDEFHRAVPATLSELCKSLKLSGSLDLAFSKLQVRPAAGGPTAATRDANDPPLDIDFAVKVDTGNAALDVGVPLADIRGGVELTGSSRAGKLKDLSGAIQVAALSLAGRQVSDFRATLYKPAEQDALQLGKIEAKIASGTMAGEVNFVYPDNSASRYALALVLRNADVPTLTGEREQDIRGQLTASLAVEGSYNDPATRRGRGDVSVVGEQMYRIPLVLGLLQITNLALPITSPFREASARYSINGSRVTLEQIELRAKEMLMQGTGHLDFSSGQVRMTFTTDSAGWPKLPFIGDLLQTARQELLQIQVRGTLQDPKVSATSLNTFTTTVDEVFRGNEKSAAVEKK
jgi:hypothetical protein